MRIVHIGFYSSFTENMKYQDNQLSHQNALDGHTVTYISNAQKYVDGKIVNTGYEKKILNDGVCLIRLPFVRLGNSLLTNKLKCVSGLYELLDELSPDIIFIHGLGFMSVSEVMKFKRANPTTKLFADTHMASYNSGTNWLSLHILHRTIYRKWIQSALPYIEKYFYVGENEAQFAIHNYKVPEKMMEFFPLGGNIPSVQFYRKARMERRNELKIPEDGRLYMHSGKLDKGKRTAELLNAFFNVEDEKAHLIIIGSIPDDQKDTITNLVVRDRRVRYLGWKTGDELIEYLCASDLYCQPGSVSATMQNAVCNFCPVMTYPHKAYQHELDWGNLIFVENQRDIEQAFREIADNPEMLIELKEHSKLCAEELLDYRKIAARMYV